MRVILKPAGIGLLAGSFALLAYVAVRHAGTPATPAPGAANAMGATPVAAPTPLWGKPKRILEPDIVSAKWHSLISDKVTARSEAVEAKVPGHPMARRIQIDKISTQYWDVQIAHPLEGAFKKGQHLRVTFWAHSKQSCPLAAVVEQAASPYEKLKFEKVELTPEWQKFTIDWDQPKDTSSGWAQIDFQAGYQPGVIEITGVIIDEMQPLGS